MVLSNGANNHARRLLNPYEAETTISAIGRAVKRQRVVEMAHAIGVEGVCSQDIGELFLETSCIACTGAPVGPLMPRVQDLLLQAPEQAADAAAVSRRRASSVDHHRVSYLQPNSLFVLSSC